MAEEGRDAEQLLGRSEQRIVIEELAPSVLPGRVEGLTTIVTTWQPTSLVLRVQLSESPCLPSSQVTKIAVLPERYAGLATIFGSHRPEPRIARRDWAVVRVVAQVGRDEAEARQGVRPRARVASAPDEGVPSGTMVREQPERSGR